MGADAHRVQLNLKNRCIDNICRCQWHLRKPGGLDTKKVTDDPNALGFVSYIHEDKDPFTLLPDLGDEEELKLNGEQEVKHVTSVSVYYWDKDKACNTPLLLKITKQDHPQTIYYKRYEKSEEEAEGRSKVWKQYNPPGGTSLQALLDERNLGRNNRYTLHLDQPDKNLDVRSNSTKNIKVEPIGDDPQVLTGSNYTFREYKLNGQDNGKGNTRFSTVIYDKKNTSIEIPNEEITNFKLYFSGKSKVPTAVLFQLPGGKSRLIYSKNEDGTDWQEHGSDNTPYDRDSRSTVEFIKQLDVFTCEHHKEVTIDLSSSINESYCCNKHGGKESKDGSGKVSVSEVPVRCKVHPESSHITAKKHTITGSGYKLAGIRYESGRTSGTRKSIILDKQAFPISNVHAVHAFYSSDRKLVLLYMDSSQDGVKGWYQKGNGDNGSSEEWTKVNDRLKDITPSNFGDLKCNQWNKLAGVLKEHGTNLEECKGAKQRPELKQLQQEIQKQEDSKEVRPVKELEPLPEEENRKEKGAVELKEEEGSSQKGAAPGPPGPKGSPGNTAQAGINGGDSSNDTTVNTSDAGSTDGVRGGKRPVEKPDLTGGPGGDLEVTKDQETEKTPTTSHTAATYDSEASTTVSEPAGDPAQLQPREPSASEGEGKSESLTGPTVAATSLWLTFGVSSGPIAGAGGLTGFGGPTGKAGDREPGSDTTRSMILVVINGFSNSN